jgi:hypothetical protein
MCAVYLLVKAQNCCISSSLLLGPMSTVDNLGICWRWFVYRKGVELLTPWNFLWWCLGTPRDDAVTWVHATSAASADMEAS